MTAETYSAAAARRARECLAIERETVAKARDRDLGRREPARVVTAGIASAQPGAFSAVARASDVRSPQLDMFVAPEALRPLPRAVLIHVGHDLDARPVAVGVPSWVDGAVRVDGIFASLDADARRAWAEVRGGQLPAVSTHYVATEFHRGGHGRMVRGVLVAVDLCARGRDPRARLTRIADASALTPAEREVQRRFDDFLADPGRPDVGSLMAAAEERGAGALEPLRAIVAPLLGDWTPRSAFMTAVPDRARCGAALDGLRCDKPSGHGGFHFAENAERCATWDPARRAPLRSVS